MRIALDAMGGDRGPELIIQGALLALRESNDFDIVLLGPEDFLEKYLADQGVEQTWQTVYILSMRRKPF